MMLLQPLSILISGFMSVTYIYEYGSYKSYGTDLPDRRDMTLVSTEHSSSLFRQRQLHVLLNNESCFYTTLPLIHQLMLLLDSLS